MLVEPTVGLEAKLHIIPYPASRHGDVASNHRLSRFIENHALSGRNLAIVACDPSEPIVQKAEVERVVFEQLGNMVLVGRWQSDDDAHADLYDWLNDQIPRPGAISPSVGLSSYSSEAILDASGGDGEVRLFNTSIL